MTSRALHLEPDLQLRVDRAPGGEALDVRLHRRPIESVEADGFAPTSAGFRLPLSRATELADLLREVVNAA